MIEGDIRNYETCLKATKDIDIILHEAALGSIPRSINDPITTNDVNVNGFLNMLVSARDSGVKRFIFATSSSVYGDSQVLPKSENNIEHPLSPLFIKQYIAHKQPVINGDGLHSRDFTYIDNVVQMNMLAIETQSPATIHTKTYQL